MDKAKLAASAAQLVQQYARQIDNGIPIGNMSTSSYDTAWASMISKNVGGHSQWLFPESFQMLLDTQHQEGGWAIEESEIDGILNTMAALSALLKHENDSGAISRSSNSRSLRENITRAVSWLHGKLQVWNVAATDHVGFEMLVPLHMKLLSEHQLEFDFPGKKLLLQMYEKKISKFDPRFIYSGRQTTFAHSMEAFIGKLDFNLIKKQLSHGSMMASPSATSAYLIHSTTWDNDAENYLRQVFESGAGKENGGFPSAFPSDAFELSWTMSTFLDAGFTPAQLGESAVETLVDHLQALFKKNDGVVGFSEGLLPDADDTAKVMAVLHTLGRQEVTGEKFISQFWAGNYFRTYHSERNPSISANCNALKALVALPTVELYTPYLTKTVTFLCDMWDSDEVKDKWNLSPEYSTMLLTQGLMKLLQTWDSGDINELSDELMLHRVPMILVQALSRTLRTQLPAGSWGEGSCEVTAYAICTLVELYSSPWTNGIKDFISSAILRGREYLLANESAWEAGPKLWIEKVTYKIPNLAKTYCIAALQAPTRSYTWLRLPSGPHEKTSKMLPKFFAKLPIFSTHTDAEFKLQIAIAESFPFLEYLRSIKTDIFPQDSVKAKEDKYLEYIPFTWTACNTFGKDVPLKLLKEMMVLSMLNYQVDEYMEDFVGKNFKHNLESVDNIIEEVCGLRITEKDVVNGVPTPPAEILAHGTKRRKLSAMEDIQLNDNGFNDPLSIELRETLSRYVNHILQHPIVLKSPAPIQSALASDLSQFLKAHVSQIRANIILGSDKGLKYGGPETFQEWVRGSGSLHTSCPMSFAFFSCLISGNEDFCFQSPKQKHLANDVRMHLAAMCRIYNDCGSIRRDREEGNLNSADFPEFDDHASLSADSEDSPSESETRRKTEQLLEIASYERECMLLAFGKLKDTLDERHNRALELFVDVTDLYGQIYVARDIGVATGKQS